MAAGSLPAIDNPSKVPDYRTDEQQRVVEISNLSAHTDVTQCHPDDFEGRIVKRDFDRRGTVPTGILVEAEDGERTFINIDINTEKLGLFITRWIVPGLQRITREGNKVSLTVMACGAAGRFFYLDAIRLER